MTNHHDVSITLTDHGTKGRVYIDGTELEGVRGFTLAARAGNVARLEIDLITYEAEVHGKFLTVVPDMTNRTLRKLGWTPPGEHAENEES